VVGPFIVGIPQGFNSWFSALVFGVILGFVPGLLAILSLSRSEGVQRIVWAIVSVCLFITVLDIGLRPLKLPAVVEPDRTYVWPAMPLVMRFSPNVRYRGTTYGGLAAEAGMPALADVREYTVITDQFGFRNESIPQQPLDLITLGDSFTAGHGITQGRMWPAILSKRYGLAVYNLGISGDGPWRDYANLLMELDRLPLKDRGTVAIWNLYNTALFRPCYGIFDKRELPWRTGLGRLKSSFKNFRVQSPLGQMFPRVWARATARGGESQANTRDIVVRQFPNGSKTFFVSWNHLQSQESLEQVQSHPDYGCMKRTIVAMKGVAESKHIVLGILAAPTKDDVYSWLVEGRPPWSVPSGSSGLSLAVAEICREEHIPFLDLKPALVAAAKRVYDQSGGQLYWRDDTHWSVEGNDEVARIAHQFYILLRSSGPAGD